MRVATWNMGYWSYRARHEDAWRWILDHLNPDVLLAQECLPPAWLGRDHAVVFDRAYPSGNQTWGSAVVSRLPATPRRLVDVDDWFRLVPMTVPGKNGIAGIHRADGWITAAEVVTPGLGPVLTLSVHSPAYPLEDSRLTGIDISGMKLKRNPHLWLLDVLFYFLRSRLGSPLLVGGDFNYSRLLDDRNGEGGNAEFFDRVASEGFVSLHRRFHEQDEQTYFHPRRRKHQLDYLYSSASVGEHATACSVTPYEQVREFSDHAPLVCDFDSRLA
ncbi:MAG: endonuclease/exonuclease/phosphatase family protein [Deltaproteobacteria bacterium]|nr:endonuclease/exonuclease/phosphatase family protein [Deltaproteobacteria bacterium]